MFTGIVTVVICAILSYIAWRLGKQERYFWALLMLLLAGLFLRLFVASDPFLHMWDERYHALVAKNLMQHPLVPMLYDRPILNFNDFNWVDSHIWLHKQPVPLWGISASLYCFGVNDFAVRFPSILISSLGILLMNDLARRMFNRKVGLYAAFFYAINGWVLEMVSGRTPTDHVDVFFAFFILLAVVLAYRFAENRLFWWNILTGAAIGLAILSKWLPALIVVPIWLCFLLHFKFKIQQILLHGVEIGRAHV